MWDALFSGEALWFAIPAVIGTVFFAFRLVLMVIGGDAGMAGHFDAGAGHAGDLHHGDPADAFKLLSIQSIAAFFMGFGWGGLGAYRGADWPLTGSIVFAFGTGIGMMWLLALLFRAMLAMQSSGNVSIDDTVGIEGAVYATVPAQGQGRGQVKLVVGGRQRIFDAVSDGESLPFNARVRVVSASENNTVTVTAA